MFLLATEASVVAVVTRERGTVRMCLTMEARDAQPQAHTPPCSIGDTDRTIP